MNKNVKAIIVIVLILVAIIGIWFYKNSKKELNNGNIENQKSSNIEENIIKMENNLNYEENENSEKSYITNEIINQNNVENETLESNEDFELEANENFNLEKLKSYKLPIILDFGADYCAPCREMKPILKKLNEEFRGKAIIKICDVMEYPNYTQGYDVSLIPTQIFINSDGTPFSPENYRELGVNLVKDTSGKHIYTSHVGYLSEKDLRNILKEMK